MYVTNRRKLCMYSMKCVINMLRHHIVFVEQYSMCFRLSMFLNYPSILSPPHTHTHTNTHPHTPHTPHTHTRTHTPHTPHTHTNTHPTHTPHTPHTSHTHTNTHIVIPPNRGCNLFLKVQFWCSLNVPSDLPGFSDKQTRTQGASVYLFQFR
jgi:hypothetical protein